MGLNSEQFSQRIRLSLQIAFSGLKPFQSQMNADECSLLENETADAVNALLFNKQSEQGDRTVEQKKLFSLLHLLQLLFQMEDLLCFERSTNAFKSMMLAQLMAENIIKEWALVEEIGAESIAYYGQRLTEAEQQLNRAQVDCVGIFIAYNKKIADQDAGLHDLLQNYIEVLNKALVLEKDTRVLKGWVAYLPWHDLLISLSQTLFSPDHIKTASPERIDLDKGLIDDMVQGLTEDNQSSLRSRKADYSEQLASVQNELAKVSKMLSCLPTPSVSPVQISTTTAVSPPLRYMFLAKNGVRSDFNDAEGTVRPNRS